MSASIALKDPRRYFEEIDAERSSAAEQPPVCLYLEVTNRCNLLCETCPRTFETLEPPADMSWELFTRIVDQVPNVARVVMHGVGEPMLVKNLPAMVRYLKDRGTYVLFNTNGTLMQPKQFQELIDTGLDELRVSLDAANRESYAKIRGKDFFNRIVRDVGKFVVHQKQVGATTPRVSLWLTGMKETVEQLPDFVRLAATWVSRRCIFSALFSTSRDTAWRPLRIRSSRALRRLSAEPSQLRIRSAPRLA